MTEEEFEEYVNSVVEQAAVSFSKTAWKDENEFESLKRVLRTEIDLGFRHLLVTK